MKNLVLFTFLVIFCASAWAAEDLQELIDKAALSKDKVLKLEGKDYVLTKPIVLTNKHSGLTIIGDVETNTRITSIKELYDWQEVGGGVWKTKVGDDFTMLNTIENYGEPNELNTRLAQSPNDGYFFIKERVPNGERGGSSTEFIVDKKDVAELLTLSKEELKNVRIDAYMSWIHMWLRLESLSQEGVDKESVILKFLPPASCRPFFIYDQNPRFKILNTRASLDEVGEYYFDAAKKELYYKFSDDEKAPAQIYATLETLLVVNGESAQNKIKNIKFKNIIFTGTTVKSLENGAWHTSAQGATTAPSMVKVENASGIEFSHCIFGLTGGYAVELGKSVWDSKISTCVFSGLGAGGIKLGVTQKAKPSENLELDGLTSGRIEVTNNLIYGYGREFKSGCGILAFDVNSCNISNNEIFDGYYTGISVGWTWGSAPTHTQNNKINYNKIHHLSFGEMSDLGGIYTLGSSEGSEIIGNVIYDITCHNYGGWGIYNDEGSSGFVVRNNYAYNTQEGGYFMHYGSNCLVENNIFENATHFQVGLGRHNPNSFIFRKNLVLFEAEAPLFRGEAPKPENAKFENNVYYRGGKDVEFGKMSFDEWQKSGQDVGSFVEKTNSDKAAKKVGFEKLDIDKAGIYGRMKKLTQTHLKYHKFRDVARRPKKANFPRYIDDNFSREKLGKMPILRMEFLGEKAEVIQDENLGKVVEVTDLKTTPNWKPYFYYRCNFIEKETISISFKVKLSEKSRFIFELRENEGVLGRGAKFEVRDTVFVPTKTKLPTAEWLDFEMFVNVNGDEPYALEDLKISSNGKELVKTKIEISSQNPSKTFGWLSMIFTGDDGAKTQLAEFKTLPKK